ncbi:hypothetical protein D9M71_435270 [compost metagenome]
MGRRHRCVEFDTSGQRHLAADLASCRVEYIGKALAVAIDQMAVDVVLQSCRHG